MQMACVVCGEPRAGDRCPQCGAGQAPGGYVVERLLAQTAHSRMYVATGPDGRRVALKELVFAFVPGAQELDAFEREAAVLKELDVPGVPRLIAAFQDGLGVGTRLYLAQEFVEGTSLADRLRAGPIDEGAAIAIARRVLEILDRLHSRTPPVVHRDVKPANLLERADGEMVLVDFGSARVLANAVTFRSTLVGTYGYMPPEQLGGSVDATADLYALGATLAHLLTGTAPTTLMGDGLVIDVDARIPATRPFQRWLSRLLAPARTKRFPSAREALRALEATSTPAPAAAPPSRRAVLAATVVLVCAGLAGLFVVREAGSQEPAAPARVEVRPAPTVRKPNPKWNSVPVPSQDDAPLEIVSLERVLPAGTRAAFWLASEFEVEVASRRRNRWGYGSYDPVATSDRTCTDAPLEFITGYAVTLPREMTGGGTLQLRLGGGYRSDTCDDLRMRLLSEDGEEMHRISETSTPEWVVLRHIPRYVLLIDRPGTPLEVRIDLAARKITLPH